MPPDINLSQYRIEVAQECLDTAKINIDAGQYKAAANRSYYCVFNAMRGVLALDDVDFKKHKGVINYFRENYIKTNIFEKTLSKTLDTLFRVRNASDYDDFYAISKEEVNEQIEQAEYFLGKVKEYLLKI